MRGQDARTLSMRTQSKQRVVFSFARTKSFYVRVG